MQSRPLIFKSLAIRNQRREHCPRESGFCTDSLAGRHLLGTIADKLLIGIILVIAAFWLNERLEQLKGQIALQNAIALSRASAFGALWNLIQPLTPRGEHLPMEQDCAGAFSDLRKWYYSESGAMHLSLDATDLCLKLLNALESRDAKAAKRWSTALRTQLKVDLGLYTVAQAKIQLPRAGSLKKHLPSG